MATLKKILGSNIEVLDDDPVVKVGAWSSGGNLNTARKLLGGAGTISAGLAVGGEEPSIGGKTESYDGSSWTETTDLATARAGLGLSGTSTAAIAATGDIGTGYSSAVESWNGSAWSEVAELNTGRSKPVQTGTSTAANLMGGVSPGSNHSDLFEQWNGSAWTETTEFNTGRAELAGAGINTATLIYGGNKNPNTIAGETEYWNGSSWTETADLTTSRKRLSGGGVYNSALAVAGFTPSPNYTTLTESWDNTSWTESADLSTGRSRGASDGPSSTVNLAFGGDTGSVTNTTEEWTFPPATSTIRQEGQLYINSATGTLKGFERAGGIPAATFASGASLNTARGYHGGSGTNHEDLLAFGGTTGTAVNNVEQYDGSSWSEVAEINTTRANLTGFGSSTAAIAGNGSTPTKVETESWNGSAWSEIAELNFSRSDSASAGTQTSGMVATGTPVPGNPSLQPGGTSTVTETWNGTSWTEVGDTNTKRLQAGMAMGGSITAGIIAAGEDGPGSRTLNAETWDGTSWTEVNNLSNQRGTLYNFMGNSSLANAAGGYSGTARVAKNEHWNGSSWTEINDLSTARNALFGAGSAVNGAVFGGDTGDYQSATEELIADITNTTITTS